VASFMIISFALWFDACHAALAAAQEGDLVARQEAGNPNLDWRSDAQREALSFYHGLDTSALSNVTVPPPTGPGDDEDVSVTVTGSLNWLWSIPISETVSGPEECFHTAASGGTSCQ
jgi:hypothetical protein